MLFVRILKGTGYEEVVTIHRYEGGGDVLSNPQGTTTVVAISTTKLEIEKTYTGHDMRFPTMWYVRPAKP